MVLKPVLVELEFFNLQLMRIKSAVPAMKPRLTGAADMVLSKSLQATRPD